MEEQKLIVDLSKFFDDHGVKYRENSSGELIMDSCYNCGRAKKLYVSKEKGLFTCFRCGEVGNATKLVAKYLNISFKEANKLIYGAGAKIYASPAKVAEEEDDEPLQFNLGGLTKKGSTGDLQLPEALKLPPELQMLGPEHTAPYNYLINRGYTAEDIEDLKLLVLPFATFNEAWQAVEQRLKKQGLSGEKLKAEVKLVVRYFERIIFPVYVDYNVLGFVARDYTGTKQPKVLNSAGNFRSFSVWNYDNAKNSEELVICEGTSSAVKCRISRSIALLGKVATPGQVRLMKKMKAKKVYICLDVGTDKEVENLYKSLSMAYPGKVYNINLPPVIVPKIKISEDFISTINTTFTVNWTYDSAANKLSIEAPEKNAILGKLQISNKLPSDEKRDLFWKKIKAFNLSEEVEQQLAWVIFESEYLDSGDYTHEEMDYFISQAQIVRGGMSI